MENLVFKEIRNNLHNLNVDFKSNFKGNKLVVNYFGNNILLVANDDDLVHPIKVLKNLTEDEINTEFLTAPCTKNNFCEDNYINVSDSFYTKMHELLQSKQINVGKKIVTPFTPIEFYLFHIETLSRFFNSK